MGFISGIVFLLFGDVQENAKVCILQLMAFAD